MVSIAAAFIFKAACCFMVLECFRLYLTLWKNFEEVEGVLTLKFILMATLLPLSLHGHFFFLQLRLDPKMYRNETYYVDLGRSQCFTAMKGISGPGNPTLIMKLYKHMASTRESHTWIKVENFAPLILLPEFKVHYIESLMPSKKTNCWHS